MKKILYIDNRQYGHNADLHIEFISSLNDQNNFEVIGYGNFLKSYIKTTYSVPIKSNNKKYGIHQDIDIKKSNLELDKILKIHNPDIILTYNSNGSSYEVGLDNMHLFQWVEEKISKIHIPKYHITTDYCRSGFRAEQAKWFDDLGYTAGIFRHKESLKYDLTISKYWLPFSIDKGRYEKNLIREVHKKDAKVGFLGAAHNSSAELYSQRIAAINFLEDKGLIKLTKILDNKFNRKILLGDEYVKFLTSNMFNLTCGGTSRYFTAKYIQIPAAHSMLVCSETNGLEIYPKDLYIQYDINNLNKLYEDIMYHINNPKVTQEKINELYSFVIKNFNHNKIKKNLLDIFSVT